MRIDKYLKNSRIIKRRTVAKEACEQGRVFLNGKAAKPGDEVEVGDNIEINFGNASRKIQILRVDDNVSKDKAQDLYKEL
ncbi:RNA-binding S4 domain-containing protein [Sporanaerobacter acetigenes]|uniref:RQC P-site tRNA stabilizing factor n=1 Tax=Sporanaerobacter acetigenes DSM 13106 TaxID=1123281 RepID=A0A1M5Y5P2_9FIRM|nr:RNA-binding S4 domain-containing protein [Sporanaerobacter acetigenes]SHI07401.1 Ribosomal 50S subunit-recycling heat shock protein, contains S4 domain [Sporanaerobacter acetigenes DSM 13106]